MRELLLRIRYPFGYVTFCGEYHNALFWEKVPDPSDSPPFQDMGPDYEWRQDMILVRRDWWRRLTGAPR